jgi:RND superfamily putative drug exporter
MRRLGQLVLRRRRLILALAVVFLPVAAVVGGDVKQHLSAGGFADPSAESTRASRLLESRFANGAPNVVVLVTAQGGADATVDDPAVEAAGLDLAGRLAAEPGIRGVKSYWGLFHAPPLRSLDGRQALILAQIPGDEDAVRDTTQRFADRYRITAGAGAGPITADVGGAGEVFRQIEDQAGRDLKRAESLALPLTLLLLVFVFGSVVAAGLPLAVGALAVAGTWLVLRLVAAVTDVSIFALNLTTGMGLGLAIDYSLFIVSRYREELQHGHEPDRAIVRTLQTAGRTVAFSALTVAVSLAALLVFPLPFLRSFAYAGVGVVAAAAAGALIVLPALLAVLGRRIDRLALFRHRTKATEDGFWYRRARAVMRRPVIAVVIVTGGLVALGVPFLHLDASLSDDRVLAPGASVRRVGDAIRSGFSSREAAALAVVSADEADLSGDAVDGYAKALSTVPGVTRVDAATGHYLSGLQLLGPTELSRRFTAAGRGTWLSIVPSVEPFSPAGEALVKAVRATPAPFPVLVGGEAARLVDGKAALARRLPLALALIALTTFVLLFLMVGSLLVPLKALVLNILSLSATFGALVFVFQEGHLAGLLHFTPTGTINVFTPVLLFCIAFGLSMDYEVFLLSRIKEEFDQGVDNDEAVAVGLERTGRIVTAAALLMAVVFVALATAQVTVVKTFGVGLTLAVLVDAFLIRATLVPAFMRLAGRANWYAPRPLRRLHLRYGIWETEPLDIVEAVSAGFDRPSLRNFPSRAQVGQGSWNHGRDGDGRPGAGLHRRRGVARAG